MTLVCVLDIEFFQIVPVCLIEAAMHKIKIFGWKRTFQMEVFSELSVGVEVVFCTAERGFDVSLLSLSASSLIACLLGSVIVVIAKAATINPIIPLT